MTHLRLALPVLLVMPLAGCLVPLPVPEGTPGAFEIVLDPGDSCGARGLQNFVGQPEAAVRGMQFQAPIPPRVVTPTQPATGELNPARVTFVVDATGKVAQVGCG